MPDTTRDQPIGDRLAYTPAGLAKHWGVSSRAARGAVIHCSPLHPLPAGSSASAYPWVSGCLGTGPCERRDAIAFGRFGRLTPSAPGTDLQ
jgi:hypothetical protein